MKTLIYSILPHTTNTWTRAKVTIQCYFMWCIHTDKNKSLKYWLLVGIPPLLLYPILYSGHLGTWNSPTFYLKISWDRLIKRYSIWLFSVEVKITKSNFESTNASWLEYFEVGAKNFNIQIFPPWIFFYLNFVHMSFYVCTLIVSSHRFIFLHKAELCSTLSH